MADLAARLRQRLFFSCGVAPALAMTGCAGTEARAASPSTVAADEEALMRRVESRESWIMPTCPDVHVVFVGTREEPPEPENVSPHVLRDYIIEGCDFAEDATCDDVSGCITDSMRREHVVPSAPPASSE